jgi:hypothetical protein
MSRAPQHLFLVGYKLARPAVFDNAKAVKIGTSGLVKSLRPGYFILAPVAAAEILKYGNLKSGREKW